MSHTKTSLRENRARKHRFPVLLIVIAMSWMFLFNQTVFARKITYKEASDIVMKDMLKENTKGKRVYGLNRVLAKNKKIPGWHDSVTVPHDGYLFFIDLKPLANWGHECIWVFVSTDGKVTNINKRTPPRDKYMTPMKELTDSKLYPKTTYKKVRKAIAERQRKLFGADKIRFKKNAITGDRYALLISGGASTWNNHIRYWGDIAFIYRALVNYYGYDPSEIVVCMSDGDDPAVDRSDGTSSPTDLDGDGVSDYSNDALRATVLAELQHLVDNVGPDDQVFIFITDHGENDDTTMDDVYIDLWDWEVLHDHEFADYIDQLPADTVKIICMENCFSGGFVDDIQDNGTANVVMSTAAGYWESSWAGDTYPEFNEFVYEWIAAVNFATDDIYGTATPVDADTDVSAICEIDEAHQWAAAHDDTGESPQWLDSSGIGGTANLWGIISQDEIDIVQVLDCSGSMVNPASSTSSESKIDVLKLAADQFVQVMEPDIGNQLGLVRFNADVIPFAPADDADLSPLTSARVTQLTGTTIPGLSEGGRTSIGDGLSEAHTQLTGPSAEPGHRKAILLVSDGKENEPIDIADIQPDLISDGIIVYPLGLGYGSYINESKLTDLAAATGGDYRITSDDLTFRKFFLEMLVYSADWSVITDPVDTLEPGAVATVDVPVTTTDKMVTFSVIWEGSENALDVKLITPSGDTVPKTGGGIRYVQHPFYAFYQLDFPLSKPLTSQWAGQWKLKLKNAHSDVAVRYSASAYGQTNLKLAANFDKLQHLTGEKVQVTAKLTKSGKPLPGASITAYGDIPQAGLGNLFYKSSITKDQLKPDLSVKGDQVSMVAQKLHLMNKQAGKEVLERENFKLKLFDDGKHNDGKANDGTYGNTFANTTVPGSYTFRFVATGIPAGQNQTTSREWTKGFYNSVNIDPAYSTIDIKMASVSADGLKYTVKVVPRDALGNYFGPGHQVAVKILIPKTDARQVLLTDNIDSTYSGVLYLSQQDVDAGAMFRIDIDGTVFTAMAPPDSRKWSFSIHAGMAIPVDSLANDYKSGFNVLFDVGYRLKPRLTLLGLAGYNVFKSKNPGAENYHVNHLSVNLKFALLQQNAYSIYINGGPGIYLPKYGNSTLGANFGCGVDVRLNSAVTMEAGIDYHTAFGTGIRFVHSHGGFIFHF